MARCSITISKEGTSAACLRDSNARISTFAPSLYGLRWQYKPRCLLTAALRKPSSSSASEPGSASNLSPSKRAPARLWGLIGPGNARSREVKQEPLVLSATSPSEKQLAASRGGKKTQPSKRPTGSSGPGNDDEEEETFGLFNLSRYNDPWDVPWDGKTVVGGMLLWLGAFVGVGFIGVPYLYKLAGINIFAASAEDRTGYALVAQLAETAVSLLLIRRLTQGSIKEAGGSEALGLFNYNPQGAFSAPRGWLAWGLFGCALAPVVVTGTAALVELANYDTSVGGKGTVDGVAGMLSIDTWTYVSLVGVAGVLAPLLEETVFRGFLLTSLSKYMPMPAAILLSSFAFGLCHLSPRDLPVLTALGCLLGMLYVRSRNLLTPMLVHGLWNTGVVTLLFVLTRSGVDIQQMLQEMRT